MARRWFSCAPSLAKIGVRFFSGEGLPIYRLMFCPPAFAAVAFLALTGCQWLGPAAINQGRDRYNGVIQTTSMEQTMSNIVRVYNHQPTLFMDVTEVDASQTFLGSLTGAATSIGAEAGNRISTGTTGTYTGRLGSATGTAQYTESPTIRYQPLLGQALVAQLVTPVNVNSLAQLYDSGWSIASVLDFATDYITIDPDEYYLALNTIDELDARHALELVAAKSDTGAAKSEGESKPIAVPKTAGGNIIIQTGGNGGGSSGPAQNDALVIYLLPFHMPQLDQQQTGRQLYNARRYLQLWARLLRVYQGTQPEPEISKGCKAIDLAALDKNIDTAIKTFDDFKKTAGCLRPWIELRISPVPYQNAAAAKIENHAPMLRTRSALGILKTAVEVPAPLIEFMSPAAYHAVVSHPWNQDVDGASYYILLPADEDSFNCPPERKAPADPKKSAGCDNPLSDKTRKTKIADWIGKIQDDSPPFAYETADPNPPSDPARAAMVNPEQFDFLDDESVRMNGWLGKMRRYMLIVVADSLPGKPPYVSYSDGEHWYYIDAGDKISQKNFQLLTLFLTMMAIPSQTPPLTPTISVGGS